MDFTCVDPFWRDSFNYKNMFDCVPLEHNTTMCLIILADMGWWAWLNCRICAWECGHCGNAAHLLLVRKLVDLICFSCLEVNWGVFLSSLWQRSQKVLGICASLNCLNEAISSSVGMTLDCSRYSALLQPAACSRLLCLITLGDTVAFTANIHEYHGDLAQANIMSAMQLWKSKVSRPEMSTYQG